MADTVRDLAQESLARLRLRAVLVPVISEDAGNFEARILIWVEINSCLACLPLRFDLAALRLHTLVVICVVSFHHLCVGLTLDEEFVG